MFGIGLPEIIVILLVSFLVFGTENLPKIARSLGRAVKEFKKAQQSLDEDDSEKLNG